MSAKDYRALADALKNERPSPQTDPSEDYKVTERRFGAELQWQRMVRAVANVCAADNVRFDRGRFYAACDGGNDASE